MLKNTLKQIVILLGLLTLIMSFNAQVKAEEAKPGDLPSGIVKSILDSGNKSGLPSYSVGAPNPQGKPHEGSSYYSGATEITSAILYAVDFLKYVVAGVAVLYLIISSMSLISAGYKVDEVITQEKESLKWILLGLVTIFAADAVVNEVFFGREGDIFEDTDFAIDYATSGTQQIRGAYNLVKYVMGSLAVLVIIISGFRLIVQAGSEEGSKSAKNNIWWAIVGLVAIGLAELVVQIFYPYFPEESDRDFFVDAAKLEETIVSITSFVASFITTLGISAIAYAGFLYIFFFGQDDVIDKAKKIIKWAIIGILIALSSFPLIATFIILRARF